ncbi:FUSC family protein [Flammeovirga pacifica]|uniref:Integral membrane bound transporter domain-containing protein n=1 Tax=Flammeovirga pacifica TaxID=915059 RepID=A0A1S1YY46_FLAPC|nr:FUSC family protein [Flammeovirga pacifica]OHX65910.1 hypothetical protein NH26_05855 [Flammeovirga pacifica]
MTLLKSIDDYIYKNVDKVHLYRTIFVVTFTFVFVNVLKIPHGTWMCITVTVLLGAYAEFGGIIHRIKQRILGTIIGSTTSVTIYFFFHNNLWFQTIAIIILIPTFYYVFRKYPYAYLVSVFTTLIILGVSEDKSIESALWRSGNIICGGLITLLFSFIFPVRGVKELRFEMANSIELIDKLYISTIEGKFQYKEYLDDIQKVYNSLRLQRKTYDHVIRESKHLKSKRKDLENCTIILRKLGGIVELLNSSAIASEIGNKYISQLYSIKEKQEFISTRIHEIVNQLRLNKYHKPEVVNLKLTSTRAELEKLYNENSDEHTPLSPYSYVWLNYQYAQQVFKLEECIQSIFNSDI